MPNAERLATSPRFSAQRRSDTVRGGVAEPLSAIKGSSQAPTKSSSSSSCPSSMAQPGPRRPNPAERSAEAAENGGGGGGGGCCRLFQRSDSMAARSVQLIEVLDKLEHRVEALRDQAYAMEQEKEALVELIQEARSSHDMWRISEGEKEELAMTAERLLSRTLSVAVSLETVRSAAQREALRRATALVDGVAEQLQGAGDGDDPGITAAADAAACRLLSFRNACSSEPSAGAVDHKFQATVISCALEDQKRLKRRVEMLLRGVNTSSSSLRDTQSQSLSLIKMTTKS
ncbi:BAG family molecular chaperone regulator 2-like [Lampetra planeri]